jgi:type IV pilus assembly protein PilC
MRHTCLARWTRTLATLFAAGVTLTEALEAIEGVTGNLRYAQATRSIQAQLMRGHSLAHALTHEDGLFPPLVVQMCAIGEESGALEHMLDKTALHYERDVETTVARMATLVEPFIMVVLGLLIGGMVMALYLPIFQLGQVV